MVRKARILWILLAVYIVAPPVSARETLVATNANAGLMDIEGNWFSCEFAHSQIPPDDDCKMFDDDGFDVSQGEIFHIKAINSRETQCRHKRAGQCFKRTSEGIVISRDSVGTIRPTTSGFAIKYWGCTQEYTMSDRGNFFEVAPTGRRCMWTREKRYFVARYQGQIQVGDK